MPFYLGIDVGLRQLSYCLLDENDGALKIVRWQLEDLLERGGFNKIGNITKDDLHDLGQFVFPLLFGNLPLQTHVGIERQPRFRRHQFQNEKMLLFADLIWDFFREKMWSGAGHVVSVQFIDPRKKYGSGWLELCGDGLPVPKETKGKRKLPTFSYAQRKRVSVMICRALGRQFSWDLGILEEQRKKDDLADGLLMAVLTRESVHEVFRFLSS